MTWTACWQCAAPLVALLDGALPAGWTRSVNGVLRCPTCTEVTVQVRRMNLEESPAVKRYRQMIAAAEYEDATLARRTKRRARAVWRFVERNKEPFIAALLLTVGEILGAWAVYSAFREALHPIVP